VKNKLHASLDMTVTWEIILQNFILVQSETIDLWSLMF